MERLHNKQLSHDEEKKKKLRKYLLISKIHRFLFYLLGFVREKKENLSILHKLITQADQKLQDSNIKPLINPMLHYVPQVHKHHYDIEKAYFTAVPFQPSSLDAKVQLSELLSHHSQASIMPAQNENKEDEGYGYGGVGSGQFAATVVYNKKVHKKEKLKTTLIESKPLSLLEQWQEERGGVRIPQRPASAFTRSVRDTPPIVLKKYKEVAELDPELERKYLLKSEEMGIIKIGRVEQKLSPKVSRYKYR